MRILYVKRAYNTRLHTQVHALRARGHSIALLLESPLEEGYHGPGQWDAASVTALFPVFSSLPRHPRLGRGWAKSFSVAGGLLALPGLRRLRAAWRVRRLFFRQALREVLARDHFDIVISANDAVRGEDLRTLLVLEQCSGRIPVVYDCQDFPSDCFPDDPAAAKLERLVNERADGVIHTNPVGLGWISARCRVRKGLSFPNFSSAASFAERLPKLSRHDGKMHLVYCGGVQRTPPAHRAPYARDLKDVFREIASLGFPLHLHLGVRPGSAVARHYAELASRPGVFLHPFLPYGEMMRTLTRYDVGLFPLELGDLREEVERRGAPVLAGSPLSRIDTSKQYEYTLAGLPVLSAPVGWVSGWLREQGFGEAFRSVAHLGELLVSEARNDWERAVRDEAGRFAIEERIGPLEEFLRDVAGRCR